MACMAAAMAGVRRRQWVAAVAAVLVIAALAGIAVSPGGGGARGSSVSRAASGWLAARRYLEARGARVALVTEPLIDYEEKAAAVPVAEASPPGVLALVFPLQGPPPADLREAIEAHLRRGGDLLIAYSGTVGGAERALELWHETEDDRPPLAPWRWYRYVRREWTLRPERPREGWLPVTVWAPRFVPVVAGSPQVLYRGADGRPAVFLYRRLGGRVVLLPADALCNGRLAMAGNANLLESLRRGLGDRWAFDEFDHGLVTRAPDQPALSHAADLLSLHLLLLYVLAVAALARRQGPAWREEAAPGSSARGFLLGVGALHHRLGHHGAAARLLLERAREVDHGLRLSPGLVAAAEGAGSGGDLLAVARRIATQRRRRSAALAIEEVR